MSLNQPSWPSSSNDAPPEQEILINQYFVAADLYKHEDSLNWQKVNHLLYLNAALGAIVGFVVERGDESIAGLAQHSLFLAVALVGLLVSVGFAVTVWLGTGYLQNRKRAVVAVEERLLALGGERVVKPAEDSSVLSSRFQRASPTRWVLRSFPVGFALIWVGFLGYLLLRL